MADQPQTPRERVRTIAPKLIELTDDVLFGDVWERPGLSKRDRSLITVAALVALNRDPQLKSHIARALDNGVTRDEIIEVVTHMAFYSGWPTAMSAAFGWVSTTSVRPSSMPTSTLTTLPTKRAERIVPSSRLTPFAGVSAGTMASCSGRMPKVASPAGRAWSGAIATRVGVPAKPVTAWSSP